MGVGRTMGAARLPLALLCLLCGRASANQVDSVTAQLLAEVNGAADTDSSGTKTQRSVFHPDHYSGYRGGYGPVDYQDPYHAPLQFGARIPEHPLNEHFRKLQKAQAVKYAPIYNKHGKLHYKPKYYKYPKYQKTEYVARPEHSYRPAHDQYAAGPASSPHYAPPSPAHDPYAHLPPPAPFPAHVTPPPAPLHKLPHELRGQREPAFLGYRLPESYHAAPESYHIAPESYHVTEEFHVTETYPVVEAYAPPAPPVYRRPTHGQRAGKALGRFSFDPEPFIETIAIAYHENERNFGGRRQPKHHAPPPEVYPAYRPEYAPHAPEYAPPHAPEYVAPHPQEYAPPYAQEYAAPHAQEYVAPHPQEFAPPPVLGSARVRQRGFGRRPRVTFPSYGAYGGHASPQRTVTLTPYRVHVGSLLGLTAAGSQTSQVVDTAGAEVEPVDGGEGGADVEEA